MFKIRNFCNFISDLKIDYYDNRKLIILCCDLRINKSKMSNMIKFFGCKPKKINSLKVCYDSKTISYDSSKQRDLKPIFILNKTNKFRKFVISFESPDERENFLKCITVN